MNNVASTLQSILNKRLSKAEKEAVQSAISHFESVAKDAEKEAALQAIGESAARCLSDMVAALEVDYDRLEELKQAATECELDSDDASELADLIKAAGDCTHEEAEQRIQEDPLSIEVRDDWYQPGSEYRHSDENSPIEFCILLSTGGPATRIVGELDEHGQPTRARLQVQDWFTVWTDYRGDAISRADLLAYCSVFYFGE